jgi:hypothetical protein
LIIEGEEKMGYEKMFSCERCDYDLEIEDIRNTDTALCQNCGQEYQVIYVERESSWELIPIEAVEEPDPDEKLAAEPFQVEVDPAALDKDDFTRY